MIFLFKEFGGKLGMLLTELSSPKEMILVEQEDEKYQLHVDQDYLHLMDYNVNIYSAVLSRYSACTEEYDSGFDSYFGHYIVYDNETGNKVMEVRNCTLKECLEKYLSIGMVGEYEKPKVDTIRCKYFFDNGKFLTEKVICPFVPQSREKKKIKDS